MQMRPRGPAGGADDSDALAGHHQVALLHQQLRRVRVTRDQAVSVVDLEHFTILGVPLRDNDLAAGGRDDGSPDLGGKVDAFM